MEHCKIISAIPMTDTAMDKEEGCPIISYPPRKGYKILYEDGCVSWLDKKTYENMICNYIRVWLS